MTTIGYARVSTAEQAYQVALSTQVYRLKNAGAEKVYADIASRALDNRAGLMEILRRVEAGETKKVLITRLDRITSSPGLFERISQIFQLHNAKLEALDEHVDIYSVDGEFSAGLQIYFARREVRTIQLRAKKAKEAGRQKNQASSRAPWGYRYVQGRYELDHTPYLCLLGDRPHDGSEYSGRTKAELGRDVVDLFFKGGSLYRALRLINSKYGLAKFRTEAELERSPQVLVFEDDVDVVEFKPTTNRRSGLFRWSTWGIRNYLCNPVLGGHTPYNTHNIKEKDGNRNRKPRHEWDIRYNTHPDQTLMTREEQSKVEEILVGNRETGTWSGSGSKVYPLTGIIICAVCGRTMKCEGLKVTTSGTKIVYFQCKNYKESACTNKTMVRLDNVEQYCQNHLIQRAAAIADLAQTPPPPPSESSELQRLRTKLRNLELMADDPDLTNMDGVLNSLRSRIAAMEIQSQQQEVVDTEKRELLLATFSNPWYWEGLLDENKRDIYRSLIKRVVVKDGAVVDVELWV